LKGWQPRRFSIGWCPHQPKQRSSRLAATLKLKSVGFSVLSAAISIDRSFAFRIPVGGDTNR